MLDEAILFATKAHEGQFRKGTKKPYIVHPLEVKDIVMTMTEDEEIICSMVADFLSTHVLVLSSLSPTTSFATLSPNCVQIVFSDTSLQSSIVS